MDDIAETFADLFQGNLYRYGTEEGGSVESQYDWDQIIEWHLTGFIDPIGGYPIDPDSNECKWGCVDFDEGDEISLIHARNVEAFLECEGITAWVERSRSKGYHVWVFTKKWVPARIMRSALLYACEFMGAPIKEINPKQMELAPGEIGNYVRLPYPNVSYGTDEVAYRRRVMEVHDDEGALPLSLGQFVRTAWETRASTSQLLALAVRYKPEPRITHITYTVASGEDIPQEVLDRLSRDAKRLFDNGPKSADRSSTLCALAGCIARDRTHEPEEARAVLAQADRTWGKYHDRHDTEIRLDEIIDRAYSDLEATY